MGRARAAALLPQDGSRLPRVAHQANEARHLQYIVSGFLTAYRWLARTKASSRKNGGTRPRGLRLPSSLPTSPDRPHTARGAGISPPFVESRQGCGRRS